MKQSLVVVLVALTLTGCVSYSPSIPLGYVGPKATVKDSVKTYGSSKADFFYLSHVDGRQIENSREKTLRMNRGRGMSMTPQTLENPIPAKSTVLTLFGRTEYAAPILAFTNTTYQVSGSIEFTPETNMTYVVRGVLGENYSAVWLEEDITQKVVGNKIELSGSSKLGIFEK